MKKISVVISALFLPLFMFAQVDRSNTSSDSIVWTYHVDDPHLADHPLVSVRKMIARKRSETSDDSLRFTFDEAVFVTGELISAPDTSARGRSLATLYEIGELEGLIAGDRFEGESWVIRFTSHGYTSHSGGETPYIEWSGSGLKNGRKVSATATFSLTEDGKVKGDITVLGEGDYLYFFHKEFTVEWPELPVSHSPSVGYTVPVLPELTLLIGTGMGQVKYEDRFYRKWAKERAAAKN